MWSNSTKENAGVLKWLKCIPREDVPVVNNISAAQSPFQHLGAELVGVPQVTKTYHVVLRLAVNEQSQGGDDLDVQPLGKEGCFLHVEFDEFGLDVLLCQDGQVFVHDLTSTGVYAIQISCLYLCSTNYRRHSNESLLKVPWYQK